MCPTKQYVAIWQLYGVQISFFFRQISIRQARISGYGKAYRLMRPRSENVFGKAHERYGVWTGPKPREVRSQSTRVSVGRTKNSDCFAVLYPDWLMYNEVRTLDANISQMTLESGT